MTKKLVICPHCLKKGKREILGEILEDGSFSVLRFHKGETKVISKDLAIVCTCGEVVFRKVSSERLNLW